MNYPTLIFDVGGTLLHLDHDKVARIYRDAAATHGVVLTPASIRLIIESLEHELPTRTQQKLLSLEEDLGKMFWHDFYSEGFRRLGVKGDVSDDVAKIHEQFTRGELETLFDDALPALDALTERRVPLGILSNFSPNLEDLLRQFRIHRYFNFFIVSAIAGVEKPDKGIFDLAVAAAKRPRTEVVYIGDSIFHDMQGARGAGLPSILIDRDNRHPDYDGTRVQNLNALIPLIEKELDAVQA